MKKIILLSTVAAMFLAACENKSAEPAQADIEKMVNERIETLKADLQKDCDDKLMAEANRRADSVILAMGKRAPAAAKASTPKTPKTGGAKTPPTSPVKTTPSNTTRPGSDQGAAPANNTSRPGSDQGASGGNKAPSNNNNRPGANKN